MKKHFIYSILLVVFFAAFASCTSKPKEDVVKKNILEVITAYVIYDTPEGYALDSIKIVSIDTITPIVEANILFNMYNEMATHHSRKANLKLEELRLLIGLGRLAGTHDPNDVILKLIREEIEEEMMFMDKYKKSMDSIFHLIEQGYKDSTSFLRYGVSTTITYTKPNMVQEKFDEFFEVTPDFRIHITEID